jgi:gamma-glutamyltranspeptidase/glutathione hydrolase
LRIDPHRPLEQLMDRPFGQRFACRSVVMAYSGMVASSHPLATQIGLDALKKGGSAVDAAIATNAALGLMEPTGCGIGGDLFAIVWDAEGEKLCGLNASGRSPMSLTLEHFATAGLRAIPSYGPLAVSVPGAVDGWYELSERFGRLPMAELLAPAIDYADNGFPVTEIIALQWALDATRFRDYPGFAEVYMPGGCAPSAGERFVNPRLAETYRALAAEGRDGFYRGEPARKIHDYMHAHGGFLSYDDLASHRSEWVEPVAATYRNSTVYELPPNGQGIAVLQMLNILEGYDFRGGDWGSARHLHLLIEAKRLAFEDRARHYADPRFADVPITELVSKEYAEKRRRQIDSTRTSAGVKAGDPRPLSAGDTVYLTAADRSGNMVSLIQSNFRGMGSGMTPGGLGFVLQDRGEAFALDRNHANVYAPGKRPVHTIIPAFLERGGEARMSFGVMGADMQPQGQVQILMNMIDFGMNLQQAGDAPRVRHDGSGDYRGAAAIGAGTVFMESGFEAEVVETLRHMGHRIERGGDFGGYQAICRDLERGAYLGASESRKDGQAAGF